jgi:hypothetical protein
LITEVIEHLCYLFIVEAVPKLQFLEQLPLKTAVLQAKGQAIGRKTARACSKTMRFSA